MKLMFDMGELSGYATAIRDVLKALENDHGATEKVIQLMCKERVVDEEDYECRPEVH